VIVSDTSLKLLDDNDESSGTNSLKWKNNKFAQEKPSVDSAWKKGKSPQAQEYNMSWKSAAKSPRDNPALDSDNSWKQPNKNWKGGNTGEERPASKDPTASKGKRAENQAPINPLIEGNVPANRGASAGTDL
jgi:hypothetical protein